MKEIWNGVCRLQTVMEVVRAPVAIVNRWPQNWLAAGTAVLPAVVSLLAPGIRRQSKPLTVAIAASP